MQGGSQPGLLSLQRSYLRVPGWGGYKSLFSRQVLSALAVTSSGDKVLLGRETWSADTGQPNADCLHEGC